MLHNFLLHNSVMCKLERLKTSSGKCTIGLTNHQLQLQPEALTGLHFLTLNGFVPATWTGNIPNARYQCNKTSNVFRREDQN